MAPPGVPVKKPARNMLLRGVVDKMQALDHVQQLPSTRGTAGLQGLEFS